MLRAAYMATLEDPALRSEAERLQLPILPMGGAEVEKQIVARLDPSPRLVAVIASVMGVERSTATVHLPLDAVENEGRIVKITSDGNPLSLSVSGSRTSVTINGKAVDRSALVPGLHCEIVYHADGEREAVKLSCRSE
jgi:hypothetical protein